MYAAADRGEIPKDMPNRWARHTKNIKSLPDHVGDEKKGFAMIAEVAREAAELPFVEKLAADAEISPALVRHFASRVSMDVVSFVKQAYADPEDFVQFLKLAADANAPTEKRAGVLTSALQRLKSMAGAVKDTAVRFGKGAVGKAPPQGAAPSSFLDPSKGGNRFTQQLEKLPFGKSQAGRAATMAGGGGLVGGGTLAMTGGGDKAPQGDGAAQQAAPSVAAGGQGSTPSPAQQTQGAAQGGGMNPMMKGMMLGGGLGVGATMLANRGKKRDEKQARDLAVEVMRRAIEKKAAAVMRKQAADILCRRLDVVAAHMPLEKTAGVRAIQKEIASGKDLSVAIKVAFPQLPGEQRGILAARLVRDAWGWHKKANMGCGPTTRDVKTTEPESFTGGVDAGMGWMRGNA
jgi:hypothetical protein